MCLQVSGLPHLLWGYIKPGNTCKETITKLSHVKKSKNKTQIHDEWHAGRIMPSTNASEMASTSISLRPTRLSPPLSESEETTQICAPAVSSIPWWIHCRCTDSCGFYEIGLGLFLSFLLDTIRLDHGHQCRIVSAAYEFPGPA